MKRRLFLKTGLVAGAGTSLAAPAVAQSMPAIKWRLTSSFPRSLDLIFSTSQVMARAVAEATDNRFQIEIFPAGEIVPGLEAADAVGKGVAEMAHTASNYLVGKDPTFALATGIPFGLNARQQNAWTYRGGGQELFDEFYRKHNIMSLPGGNTGCQMGGWFRKEIKTVADLQGLKMRIGGLGGQIMQKLGVAPQQITGSETFAALEKGTIDAAEWVGPYDDEKLGFNKVAPFYYYPGWWEGGVMLHFFINTTAWDALPATYRSILTSAAARAHLDMQAAYDASAPAALKRLVGAGVQLRPFSQEIMEAALRTANEIYAEISSANADFKRIYDALLPFRNDQFLWWQIAEYNMDTFMIRARARR